MKLGPLCDFIMLWNLIYFSDLFHVETGGHNCTFG